MQKKNLHRHEEQRAKALFTISNLLHTRNNSNIF